MPFRRVPGNPIIRPQDVKPSREGFEVFGALNCGAAKVGDDYLLLLRVAEKPVDEPGWVRAPFFCTRRNKLEQRRLRSDDPNLDTSDPRMITLPDGRVMLTSISHLRIARSADGTDFRIDEQPAVFPRETYERFGIEDPRITHLGGRWWINYSAISDQGVTTALASTTDWTEFERHGVVFGPDDKDMCIFPEKVGGRFVCRHRPWSSGLGEPAMWTAFSPDLVHWGGHVQTLRPRRGAWDEERVGCGPPPVRTERGWLEFYHGADSAGRYSMGALLTAPDDPTRVLARSERPVLEPTEPYEIEGVYGPVVFSNGVIVDDDGTVRLYYGAADTRVGCATASVDEVLDFLAD